MRKLALLTALLVLAFATTAVAQESVDEDALLNDGFRLGKLYMMCNMVAMDLEMLQGMNDAFQVENVTLENYDAGLISDEDVTNAQMYLFYALWRVEYILLPACEGGMTDKAFTPGAATEEFKEETRALLTELIADCEAFLETSDYPELAQFVTDTTEAGYAAALYDIADRAQLRAGIVEMTPAEPVE